MALGGSKAQAIPKAQSEPWIYVKCHPNWLRIEKGPERTGNEPEKDQKNIGKDPEKD